MESQERIEVFERQGVTVVQLDAASISSSGVEPIAQALRELVTEQQPPKVVIDFSRVRFISSMMLGLLVDVWRRMTEYGGQIRICGIDPRLTRVFKITHLDKIFTFSENLDQALGSFNRAE